MSRRLFCSLGPIPYALSVRKERLLRRLTSCFSAARFARARSAEPLPVSVYAHKSLIRRQLGDVDMRLQENKAVNLALAAPRINGILLHPGETFSFWRLVGSCTRRKGYREGLTIAGGAPKSGVGGGMCQFTNLLHWLALHSPLHIAEHHHHDSLDLFPDFGRQVPFGCGTSIFYNYLDYRLYNPTDTTFQLLVYTTDTHLCGELRAAAPLPCSYHIRERDARFGEEDGVCYRYNRIFRRVVDKTTGNTVEDALWKENRARVMYARKQGQES